MRALLVLAVLACLLTLPLSPSFAAKVGETCDGIAGIKCDEGSWCEHPAGECNVADGAGTCVKDSPEACTQEQRSRFAPAAEKSSPTTASGRRPSSNWTTPSACKK